MLTKLQNFTVAVSQAPRPISYFCKNQIAFTSSQDLSLLGFFPYAILFSESLINADIFLPLYQGPDPKTLSEEKLRIPTSCCLWYLMIKSKSYLAINNNINKNNTAIIENWTSSMPILL